MSKQLDWPYVINMGNSILGVSVLAMPFCFRQCGVLLGVLLLLASAWLTGIACELLMKSAVTSKKRSYEYLALHTFGAAGKFAVEVSIIGMLLGTCVAFHVIIGDLGPPIVARLAGVENTQQLRTIVMVVLCLFVGLPLALLKNIENLSNVSAISIGFYMVFVAEVFASAFPNLWSGIWVAKVEVWNPEGVFKCLPIFSMAFGCQTQLFVMYDALPEPSIKRMNSISKNAISLCVAVYLMVGFFGYVAFCDEPVSGDILVNFRPTIFSEAVKLGFVMSVAVSFPLVVFPCRTSIHTLLFAKHSGHESFGGSLVVPEPHFKFITFATVVSTLILGLYFPNVEFILALTGSTMGSMICYIFPAVLFITLMSMSKNSSKSTAQLVLFLGVTILLASTYTTLYAQDQQAPDVPPAVVKIAEPQPVPRKDGGMPLGAGDVPNVQAKENIKKDGDDVIKDDKQKAVDGKKEEVKETEEDRRQEPPNPHAPADDNDIKAEIEDKKDGEPEVHKKTEEKPVKKKDETDKDSVPNVEKTEDKKTKNEPVQDKIDVNEKGNNVSKGKTEKELKEAKILLDELKEQRDEQKKLLDQQRELINELKLHKKEAHEVEQGAEAQQQQQKQQADVPNANVQQQPVPAAGNPALSPDAEKVAKDVEDEVAKVVQKAVVAQQEEQLHNIAKQNHQEMLESLDDLKPVQQQQQQPAQVNPGAAQAGLQQGVPQAQQVPGQAQLDPVLQGNAQLQGNMQQVPQQLLPVQGVAQQQNVQQQQVPQQQPLPLQQQQAPLPVQGGAPQQTGLNVPQQMQGQQAQQAQANVNPAQKQQQDTQDALKYVHEQGFLPDEHKHDTLINEQAGPAPVNVIQQKQSNKAPARQGQNRPVVAQQNRQLPLGNQGGGQNIAGNQEGGQNIGRQGQVNQQRQPPKQANHAPPNLQKQQAGIA